MKRIIVFGVVLTALVAAIGSWYYWSNYVRVSDEEYHAIMEMAYFQEDMKIVESMAEQSEIATGMYLNGEPEKAIGELDTFAKMLQKMKKNIDSSGPDIQRLFKDDYIYFDLALTYGRMSILYHKLNDYESSSHYNQLAEEAFKKVNNKKLTTRTLEEQIELSDITAVPTFSAMCHVTL
jgi:hypothetical protein